MKALVEPLASVVRVGPDNFVYGDPYTFACSIRWIDRQSVEMIGATAAPTPSEWRAMVRKFRELGVKRVLIDRKSGSRPGAHWIDL